MWCLSLASPVVFSSELTHSQGLSIEFLISYQYKLVGFAPSACRTHLKTQNMLIQKPKGNTCHLLSPHHASTARGPQYAPPHLIFPATCDVGVTLLIHQGRTNSERESKVLKLPELVMAPPVCKLTPV